MWHLLWDRSQYVKRDHNELNNRCSGGTLQPVQLLQQDMSLNMTREKSLLSTFPKEGSSGQ